MALTNDDENNRRLVEQFYANLADNVPITKRQAEVMEQAANSGQKRVDKEEVLIKTLGSLGKGAKDYTKAMYDGQQGLGAMNSGVDSVVMALEVVLTLIPGFRILKFVLMATVGAAAAYVKAANEQADALFKTYQDLSKTGMATAGGMTDVYNNMQRFNYGIKELGDMTALLKENSVALANFGGTAATGTKAFADAANSIQHSDIGKTFQMMGKTPDEINRGIAMFIKNQQSIGVRSTDINKNLAGESARYVMQLDLLSKLTGQSAEQLQEKLDQASAEEAFNQTQYELKKKADAGDFAAKKQYEENLKIAGTLTGTTLKEFQQGVGGDISAMGKTMMTAQGAVALIQKGSYTAAEYFGALGKGAQESRDQYGNLMKLNATKDFLLPMTEIAHLSSRYADQSAQNQEEMAKAEQLLQTKGLDPTTKEMVKLRLEQQKTRDSMQNLVNKGVGPLTEAFGFLTDVINRIVGIVPGTGSEVKKGGTETSESSGPTATTSSTSVVNGQHSVTIGNEQRTGGDRNWRSNNPGNIEYGEFAKSMGAIGSDGRFAIFPTLEMGRKAADVLLKGKHYADLSAADALKKWAPGVEKGNDPEAYASMISKQTGIDMRKKYKDMSREEQAKFLDAMNKVEGGRAGTIQKTNGTQSRTETASNDTSTTSSSGGGWQPDWISGANGWDGMLTGPASGYKPNVIMHGTEDLTITPKSEMANNGATPGMDATMMLQQQTSKLDELIRILGDQQQNDLVFQQLDQLENLNRTMQNQISVSTKILQASR